MNKSDQDIHEVMEEPMVASEVVSVVVPIKCRPLMCANCGLTSEETLIDANREHSFCARCHRRWLYK